MKFVEKVDREFSLKTLFNEHLNKFNLKHGKELAYLEDVKNFLEKKSQIELQYAQSLSKLCNQYMAKEEYQITNETTSSIYIQDKWKLILEQCSYVALKKQASSTSLLSHCEYFKKIKEQKIKFNQIAISNMKKMHETLKDHQRQYENSFKSYCLEQFLCDQLEPSTQITNLNLEKKLKKRRIDPSKFKKYYEEMIKSDENVKDRKKKLDLSKLNYVTSNFCQNQQLQYYFSMEVPMLLNLQNAQLDSFINESLNSLAFKELETSKFIIQQFEETFMNSPIASEAAQLNLESESNSDIFYSNNNRCFNNLIQYELEPHDKELNDNFDYTFQKENIKYLCSDYTRWTNKLSDLDNLLKLMLEQINAKRIATYKNLEENHKLGIEIASDFLLDEKLEQQRFNLDEKKMQMIQLESKINALGSFNINLKEIEEYDTATKFNHDIKQFESDLCQNLELWDTLMKSIDEIQFSGESYDVEINRKKSQDYNTSGGSASTEHSIKAYVPSFLSSEVTLDSNIEPRYARTLCDYQCDDLIYLSFEKDMSLLIYEEVSSNIFKAKDFTNRIGFVFGEHFEFNKNKVMFVKAVCPYEGLDEQELTFPSDALIRLVRRNTKKIRIDGEDWWEGVYENKLGYFPCIFVRELERHEFDAELESTRVFLNLRSNNEPLIQFSPSGEYQKVP